MPSYNNSCNRRGFKRFLKMAKNSVRLSTPVLTSQDVMLSTCQDLDTTKQCQENDMRGQCKKKCTKSKKVLDFGFRLWDNRLYSVRERKE